MPQKRGYRKGRKRGPKKRYNRKTKRNKATTTIVKSPGFSDTLFCKLKYSQSIRLNNGTNATVPYSFRGNSLFDPDYTSTGHQPMYFDQYALIYERYRVMGAKISIRAINGNNTAAHYLVLQTGTDVYSGLNMERLLEQPRSGISKIVPASSQSPTFIKHYCSTRKACGLTKSQVMDADYASQTTGSPLQLWYFNIITQTIDNLSVASLYCMVSIVYYVQFFDRLTADQS